MQEIGVPANGSLRDEGNLRKEAFFFSSVFWNSQQLFGPCGKGRKRAKISRKGGQTRLKPSFVTPPFAAAQRKGAT